MKARETLRIGKRLAVLLLASGVLAGIAASRSFEYDEAYSVFVTSPVPRPAWPAGVFRAGDVRSVFVRHAGPAAIARALRATDVHPPLYFWSLAAWRVMAGDSLMTMRLLSVGFALLALAVVGAIGEEIGVTSIPAMLLTLGCYGFAYTGAVARGFALAQVLTLAGVLLILRAGTRQTRLLRRAAGGGVLLGAATLANYLAAFVAVATLIWLAIMRRRDWRVWLAAGCGLLAALAVDLWFFLGQRNSRPGQFPPFGLGPSLARLARYFLANLFGGLPLYVSDVLRAPVQVALIALSAGLAMLVAWRWRRIGTPDARALLLTGVAAPPLGLLLLGLTFNTTPIELRYLCFATPFVGLLIAGALQAGQEPVSRPLTWSQRGVGLALLLVQAVSLAGLGLRPETMQPSRAVARQAVRMAGRDGIILLPRGNDGVGVVGPFLAELPDDAKLLLVGDSEDPASFCALLPRSAPIVLARVAVDAESRAAIGTMAAIPQVCGDRPYRLAAGR